MKKLVMGLGAAALVTLGAIIGGAITSSSAARAQSAGGDAAIAPAPGGGAWVVSNGTLRICRPAPIQPATRPPRPECGDAYPLR